MSNWSSTQLTDLGRALDAKVTAGTTLLSFTKMKLGSGTETAEDIPAMTDLVSPKLVLGISSCAVSASDDTICELISVASSSDVEDSFVVRELGVFATDPDVGEILYAVMLDSTPDTMPNENVSSPVTVTYQVNIVSDNASSITAVIDPVGLVTASVLQAHNDSISAHKMPHWYRQNSKVYAVGDIAFSASLPSNLVLECTTAGTTAASEPDFSGATIGGTVTDGTVVWTYQSLLGEGKFLPLSGGTMTGNITNTWIRRSNSAGESIVYGGTGATDGAIIGLRGATNTSYGAREAGSFALIAKNGANTKTLTGYPDGDLYWDGSITNSYLRRDNNTTETWLYGAQDNASGASIGLRGNQCTTFGADQAGSFALFAGNANTGPSLLGKTDGTLTWKGTTVIYSDYYTSWSSGNDWYEAYKWSNGRCEIYGHATQAANVLGIQLNYPFPLISSITAQVTVDAALGTGYVGGASFTYSSTTVGYFTIKNLDGSTPTGPISCSYKVEGRWK